MPSSGAIPFPCIWPSSPSMSCRPSIKENQAQGMTPSFHENQTLPLTVEIMEGRFEITRTNQTRHVSGLLARTDPHRRAQLNLEHEPPPILGSTWNEQHMLRDLSTQLERTDSKGEQDLPGIDGGMSDLEPENPNPRPVN
ncbi:hypothetical protein Dimus_012348 [Dionaea muscipula]